MEITKTSSSPISLIEEACKAEKLMQVISVEEAKDEYGQLTGFFTKARTMAISYGMQTEINIRGNALLVKFSRV